MDVVSIIDNYIDGSVRRRELEDTLKIAESRLSYYKHELAWASKEEGEQECAQWCKVTIAKYQGKIEALQSEMTLVNAYLAAAMAEYQKAIDTMGKVELRKIASSVARKIKDIKKENEALESRKYWALQRADEAYGHDFDEEQEFDRISSQCSIQMEKNKEAASGYQPFVTELRRMARNR